MGLSFMMAALVLAVPAAGSECLGESCASMKSQSMLQRNRAAAKINVSPDQHVGSSHTADSSEDEVVKSLKYAKETLAVMTATCSKKVIDVTLVSDTVQVVDGVEVELILNMTGNTSDQVYHKIVVLWTATSKGLKPQLLLPYENGVPLAWCTLLDASTSHSLAELAKKEGHEAVKRYHKMLGYKGGRNASTNRDKLLQVKTAQCTGSDNLPATYDLRYDPTHGPCFTAEMVHDQGGCGSCWAFAAAHAMTARLCLQDQADIISNPDNMGRRFMSVQTVLSCGTGAGCDGGWMADAFYEWQRGGAPLARDYEYHPAYGGQPWHSMGYGCEWGEYAKPYKTIDVYGVSTSVTAMMEELYCNGPFTVAYAVYNNFFGYSSGVYQDIGDGTYAGGHAVTLVGWGNLDGTDFWELQNSWGHWWGDGGFFKMLRGENFCSVESWGLSAATAAKTDGSWMFEDWSMCEFEGEDLMKTRDIKCVDNVDTNSILSDNSCPQHNGWPDKSTWPDVNSGMPAEAVAKTVCGDDDHIACSNAFCYGHGSGEDVQGTCTCTCFAGYTGERCDVCATGYEGYPECRESCTRADCSGHGDASGVKWSNEFGEQLDSCSCMCDEGYSGPTCATNCGSDCTTTTTTLGCTTGDVMLGDGAGQMPTSIQADTAYVPWVYYGGSFYPICGHYFWDNNIGGTTFCQTLGFDSGTLWHWGDSYSVDAMPVGKCAEGEPLSACTQGGNGWGNLQYENGWCTAGHGIGIQVKCHGGQAPASAVTCNWIPPTTTTTTTTACADCGDYYFTVEGPCPYDKNTACATSGNYPNTYPDNEICRLIPSAGTMLNVVDFNTEAGWDFLTVQGQRISGGKAEADAFHGMTLTEDIIWESDYIYGASGWKLCAQAPTTTTTTPHPCTDGSHGCDSQNGICIEVHAPPAYTCAAEHEWCECVGKVHYGADTRWSAQHDVDGSIECSNGVFGDPAPGTVKSCVCTPPSPPYNYKCECASGFHCIDGCEDYQGHKCEKTVTTTTTTTTTVFVGFSVTEGPCLAEPDGSCVSSPGFPHIYGDNQDCKITATPGLKLDVEVFKTEEFDVLTANGQDFFGEKDDLKGLNGMHLQGNMTWHSDESVGKEGWRICHIAP